MLFLEPRCLGIDLTLSGDSLAEFDTIIGKIVRKQPCNGVTISSIECLAAQNPAFRRHLEELKCTAHVV